MNPFLIFDAYGTLVELDDFYARLQNGFARHGLSLPANVVRKAAHAEMKHYIAHALQARDWTSWLRVRRECAGVLADAVRAQGHALALKVSDVTEVLGDAIAFRAFPDARATLEELKRRGLKMGVLSNWDYRLPLALRSLDMEQFFEFVLTSAKVGTQKPERTFFERGLEAARRYCPDLTAANCLYIGDHYEKDVLGARGAGLTPLWLVRNARDLASGTTAGDDVCQTREPVIRLNDLSELPRVLASLLPIAAR